MDATTVESLSAEIQPVGVVDALRGAFPSSKANWFTQFDACVFSYLLRLLQGQTVKDTFLEPGFVSDTIAAYLTEFDCCGCGENEKEAKKAAERVMKAMDENGLSKKPVEETEAQKKLNVPLTMSRQYEETIRKAGGPSQGRVSGNKNETWTWESKEKAAKEQRRKRKEEEKKAILKSEYEQFLQERGLAAAAHQIVKVHGTSDTVTSMNATGGGGDSSSSSASSATAAAGGYQGAGNLSAASRAATEVRSNNVHLTMGKKILIEDSDFLLLPGHHYGLVGANGSGKSSLLRALSEGDLEGVSPFIQIVHVEQEIGGDGLTPIGTLLATDIERENLMKEEKELLKRSDNESGTRLAQVYQRLDEIDAHSAEARAAAILSGLSFTHDMMMNTSTNRLSGGWRMRVALARALFVEPDVLLCDEPTNHLDLHAVLWLEQFLLRYKKTLVVVSHSRSFLNAVCSEIIHLQSKHLDYYDGNYDMFEVTRADRMKSQKREFEAQQAHRQHMMDFVNKFRASAARAKMAQSRMKALDRMELIAPVMDDSFVNFIFKQPDDVNGPLLQILDCEFGYKTGQVLFRDVNFSVDMKSRICVVGANGAGKSTFIKVLLGELEPRHGTVVKNPKCRIGHFAQHHLDQLTPQQTPLEYMRTRFPDSSVEEGKLRGQLAGFGLIGDKQLQPIYTLSGGEKSRVSLACITFLRPHLLLLDEPTNHLDLDTVSALLQALMVYGGGLIVVSHDESFIAPLCDEMFVCGGGELKKYNGEFEQYRAELAKSVKL